jgi:hypothetical protein
MSKKINLFSKNLLSLKVQLETIFEDVGGDELITLLDNLSVLSDSERGVALKMMTAVCKRLAQNETRRFTKDEKKMQELEDLLVNDITEELTAKFSGKLSLVHGGKDPFVTATKGEKKDKIAKVSPKILEFKPVLN